MRPFVRRNRFSVLNPAGRTRNFKLKGNYEIRRHEQDNGYRGDNFICRDVRHGAKRWRSAIRNARPTDDRVFGSSKRAATTSYADGFAVIATKISLPNAATTIDRGCFISRRQYPPGTNWLTARTTGVTGKPIRFAQAVG